MTCLTHPTNHHSRLSHTRMAPALEPPTSSTELTTEVSNEE